MRGLRLVFDQHVDPTTRRRIEYAFRVFCGFYGYRTDQGDSPRLLYGATPSRPGDVALTAAYEIRAPGVRLSAPVSINVASSISQARPYPAFYPSRDRSDADWLGEIFEWLSLDYERGASHLDAVGRVPFDQTLHGHFGLDPVVPYAALAMMCLNERIARSLEFPSTRPRIPWSDGSACVIGATHDLDFIPTSALMTISRYVKNVANSVLVHRDPGLSASILAAGLRGLATGSSPLNRARLVRQLERERNFTSTWTAVCRRGHPRDPSYELTHPSVLRLLRELEGTGAEIGIHGSYTSLDVEGRLKKEYQSLRDEGFSVEGGRQHWLRFQPMQLFDELVRAGALYDCSLGYSRPGFRAGACFPFPPYNFETEAPYPLLELPLTLMDVHLYRKGRTPEESLALSTQVMDATSLYGWGGTTILWHDTVYGGAQIPRHIGELYWTLHDKRDERWTSCQAMMGDVWHRFEDTGLLPRRQDG